MTTEIGAAMEATVDRAPATAVEPAANGRSAVITLGGLAAVGIAGWSVVAGGSWRFAIVAVVAAVWAASAISLGRRQPDERLGLQAAAIALVTAGGALAAALGTAWAPFVLALVPAFGLDLLLGLPEGTLGSRNRRVTAAIGYGAAALVGLALVAAGDHPPHWPVAVEMIVAGAIGLSLSNARYRRTRGPERQRMQWFGWALAVTAEAALVCLGLRVLIGSPAPAVALLATAPIPIALAVGSSPRLVGRIDRLLAHTVAVAGLTGVVTACYVVIVIGLGRVPDHSERGLLTLSMAAAGVAALLYLPARERLGRFANRLVYGEREAPDEALRTFGSRLSRAIPMDELMLQLVESLRKTLVLDRAEVWTGTPERLEITASVPEHKRAPLTLSATEAPVVARAGVSGPAWLKVWLSGLLEGREDHVLRVAPIAHSGELLGLIVADRGSGGDAFGEEEERVLTELARQVGLALHNVQLDSALQASLDRLRHQAAELQASRARIVAAGDAERRKIERNLHDGAQQHLVALAVNLRLTKTLAERDPAKAGQMLEQLTSDVQETLQELRALAHGIYPPLLMDRGLPEALNAAAGRAALPTLVEAEVVGRYNPDVEAAVYFFCMEALQNAGKHAGDDAEATVKVWRDDGMLRFSVSDTGAGFDAKHFTGGAGFTNLSDRLGAIGGSFRLDTAPGQGTTLEGWIPAEPLPAPAAP
jgi:signal transduction histidine kinase